MKSTTTPLDEPNKIKLTVELDESEMNEAIDKAFKTIAKQVNIPGFRRGKAPRKVIEAQFGIGPARAQALNDSMPDFYIKALNDNEIDAIAPPQIEITSGEEEGPVVFEAEVETRPVPDIPGYQNLEVKIPNPTVKPEEVDDHIERFRKNYAELVEVDRPCKEGDFVTLNIEAERDGTPVPGLNVNDFSYEVGSEMRSFGDGFDKKIDGLSKGDEVEFTTSIPPNDDEVEFEVEVTAVEERLLPDLTDEWIADNTEFDSVEAYRADLEAQLTEHRKHEASHAARDNAVLAVADLVTEDLPEVLVDDEMKRQFRSLDQSFRQRGLEIGQLLAATGQPEEVFLENLREQSIVGVKADLALRALAQKEGLIASDQDVEEEIEGLATRFGQKPERVRRDLESADQMPAIRSDIAKSKAVQWLVEHATLVDEDGNPVDRSLLDLDEHDHDAEENEE